MSPSLSIIIPSYESSATIALCLESLVHQSDDSTEIIVVDSGSDGAAELVAARFPEVRLLRCGERLFPGGARNRGVALASGEILGFIDADCVAAPDWIQGLLDAHARREHPAIGGVVGVEDASGALDWAAYFCSFLNWMPGSEEGEVHDIPTCCLSVRHAAFARHGPFRETGYSTDTEFNWALVDAERPLYLEPRLRVGHCHHPGWRRFLRRQLERGRAFAAMRSQARRFSDGRRALHAAGTPLLPALLMGRLLRRLARPATPQEYRRALVRSWPAVALGFGAWALGEALGYLERPASPGGSESRAR